MLRKPIFIMILMLALTSLACGLNINLTQVETGETVTETIQVAEPDSDEIAELTLAFGVGELSLNPGAEVDLLEGRAAYNVAEFKPQVRINDNAIRIEQGDLEIQGIPSFDNDVKNEWDFKLSDAPMRLKIQAGAYSGDFELGGLSLYSLEVSDGASNVELSFSEPNQVEMDHLRYETGASDVTLTGLANANCSRLEFTGGAGSYTLDFSGELQQDATVTIEAGISSITIIVPEGMAAEVEFEGALSNVDAQDAWETQSGKYILEGSGPKLTIQVKMGAGDLKLKNP